MIAKLPSCFECRPKRRKLLKLIAVVKVLVEELVVAQPLNKFHVSVFEPEEQSTL